VAAEAVTDRATPDGNRFGSEWTSGGGTVAVAVEVCAGAVTGAGSMLDDVGRIVDIGDVDVAVVVAG